MSNETWTGATGDWKNKADWEGGVPNSQTANATIAAAGTYTVSIASG